MLIAQISDLHVKAEGTLLYGQVDAYGLAAAAIERIAAFRPRPDAVVVTGDITNDGTADDFAAAARLLGRLAVPVFAIVGNHDRREAARRALGSLAPLPAEGPLAYAADAGPIRLVALDSLVEGHGHGALGPEQIAWLERTLAAASDRPTLVLVHHHPFACGIEFMDRIALEDADALAAVIARHPQVLRILCGHVHRAVQALYAGTVAMTAPATGVQVVLDLRPGAPSRWTPEPPAFLVHRWDGTRLVTHLAYVQDFGSPQAFSDDHTTVR